MRTIILSLLAMASILAQSQTRTAQSQTRTTQPQTRVACIGNSITYGHGIQDREHDTYPAQLQAMLGSEYDVHNFGVSGTTAQSEGDHPWVSTPEYKAAIAFAPHVAVIKLGTNDSKPQNWAGAERFIHNLERIATEFEALPSHPTIIIALPAKAYNHAWDINDSIIVNGEMPAIKAMAKRHKWQLIDLHKSTDKKPHLFPDGIHPTPEGAALIATKIKKAILKNR